MAGERAVVTVLGKDRVGIVAGVSAVLAAHRVNIEDIRMATMGDLFTMIALVSFDGACADLAGVQSALETAAAKLGVQAHLYRREIFDAMHRV